MRAALLFAGAVIVLAGCRGLAGYAPSGPEADTGAADTGAQLEAAAMRDGLHDGGDTDPDLDAASSADQLEFDLNSGRDAITPHDAAADMRADAAVEMGVPDVAVDTLAPDTLAPDTAHIGGWHSVDKVNCPAFCVSIGKLNVGGPETAKCASGEVRPMSYWMLKIGFKHGCYGPCTASPANAVVNAKSTLGYCYAQGQAIDYDPTDITIGCFCK
jgi:hypothetical protein